MGWAALGLDRRVEARRLFGKALESVIDAAMTTHNDFARTLSGIGLASELTDARPAARLHGAAVHLRERSQYTFKPDDEELERFFGQPLIDALGPETWQQEQAVGAALTLEETIALARSLAGHGVGEVQPLTA